MVWQLLRMLLLRMREAPLLLVGFLPGQHAVLTLQHVLRVLRPAHDPRTGNLQVCLGW